MNFRERIKQGIVVYDGAMGTQIQELQPTEQDYQGQLGCNEILNLTIPDKIQTIHEAYLAAGADVVETNTFGCNKIVLSDYKLEDRVEEIATAAVKIAKRAVDKFARTKPRFIAGSIGPGTKIASLGQTTYDAMYESYYPEAIGLIQGGVDLFMIETCQDPLQIKAALHAVKDALKATNKDIPIVVSVTMETTGTMLVGTDISAVIAIVEPLEIDALGVNCGTGPDSMGTYVKQMCEQFPGPILVMPNAGLPQNVGGKTVYSLTKEKFVDKLAEFIQEDGIQLVGGCCGTNPTHIKLLCDRVRNLKPKERKVKRQPSIASLYGAQTISQSPAPMFIGERANTNGCKQFKNYLLQGNWDGMVAIAMDQQSTGAHAMDLCVAYAGRNEVEDMVEAVRRMTSHVNLPLVIDSTEARVIEAALKLYGGRPIINSINLESGEEKADKVCQLAKKYGAALIALTIDEHGMAISLDRKLQVASRIYDIAIKRHGLRPDDLIFDMLTFTLGSGDATLRNAGKDTLEAIRGVKQELPGVLTTLGISNISFGLAPAAREVLNSVFLAEAVKAGLDTAIVHVSKIKPLYKIPEEDRAVAENLIYNQGGENPLLTFIQHFEKKSKSDDRDQAESSQQDMPLDQRIQKCVIQGNKMELEALLIECVKQVRASEIISQILIPAMKKVGEMFGSGEMQLPFVLQSAEVMKFAVDALQPYLDKSEQVSQKSIVLATVRGDVHDIGKNLTDIILSNNGYKVYNVGIKCEIDAILKKLEETKADAIGMSGLLVKSTIVMKENLEEMRRRNVHVPVLLGGAALTRNYVDETCAPILNSPVVYCEDAFAGLKAMNALQNGCLEEYVAASISRYSRPAQMQTFAAPAQPKEAENIAHNVQIPTPPFWGSKVVKEIALNDLFSYINEDRLFRNRWEYRCKAMSQEAYQKLIATHAKPELELFKTRCIQEGWFEPKVVYGYYPCDSDQDSVMIYDPETKQELIRWTFPRQPKSPHLCIADYVLPKSSGKKDLIALQVVTIAADGTTSRIEQELFENGKYKDYLLFHGLSVEITEALAEYWHGVVRSELRIVEKEVAKSGNLSKYRGCRYSFGYPSCPDIEENRKIFELLQAERVGVSLTSTGEMVPEQTTSAFILHHPQSHYFSMA